MRNMPRSSVRAPPAAKPPKPPGPADWSALWRLTVCSMTGLPPVSKTLPVTTPPRTSEKSIPSIVSPPVITTGSLANASRPAPGTI